MPSRRAILVICLVVAAVGIAVAVVARRRAAGQPTAPVERAALAVETAAPQRVAWEDELRADGEIVAWQESAVGAEVGGLRITAVLAEVGDRVEAGQELARLDDRAAAAEVAVQEAQSAQARAEAARASADLRRLREAGAVVSEQESTRAAQAEQATAAAAAAAEARLAAARLRLSQAVVLAPDAGIISRRSAVPGQVPALGSELFRLIRLGRLEWHAQVTAEELPRVAAGQPAELRLPGGDSAIGRVRLVPPTVDAATRVARVPVALDPGAARAGMFASGAIRTGEPRELLAVPASAIVLRDGRAEVVVVDGASRARVVRVTVGQVRADLVEIASGLAGDERVVRRGGGFLADGDLVRVAEPRP